MDRLPRLGGWFVCCGCVVSVWRGFLFLWVLGMGYIILLWHSLSLPYNYFGTARAIDERQSLEVENKKLEVVPEFCYLGDMLSAGGGCELAAITRCKCAWDKF